MAEPSLAFEMREWEVHALRNLVAVMLQAVALMSPDLNIDGVQYTQAGVLQMCQEAYSEFEHQRYVAFRDPAFRRSITRRTQG